MMRRATITATLLCLALSACGGPEVVKAKSTSLDVPAEQRGAFSLFYSEW